MQRFGLYSGSGHGAADIEETNCHMLREQDPCRSLDELHYHGEGAFGSSLCIRKFLALHLWEQHYQLHLSCGLKVLSLQEGGKAMTNTMGAASSRI